jgi:hypothetical protein
MVSAIPTGKKDGARSRHWSLSRTVSNLCHSQKTNSHLAIFSTALSLAMSRDGSSGGTIRMADISEKGVERHFIGGDKLPTLSAKIV